MKKLAILIITSIALSSCIKDKMTNFKAYLYNHTSVKVTILPFKGGYVHSTDTIYLNPGDSFQIGYGSNWGDVKIPLFESEIFALNRQDSVNVVFNNIYYVSHYIDTTGITLSPKYYLYNNNRSIINRENYEFEMIRDKERINIHRYYFTEADYKYAKE